MAFGDVVLTVAPQCGLKLFCMRLVHSHGTFWDPPRFGTLGGPRIAAVAAKSLTVQKVLVGPCRLTAPTVKYLTAQKVGSTQRVSK